MVIPHKIPYLPAQGNGERKMDVPLVIELLPTGVVALGAAVGYGVLQQRVKALEAQDVSNIARKVERIDERTRSTKESVESVEKKVDRLVERLLPAPRSFAPDS